MQLKKSLGQNFLKDFFYLDKIINSSQIDENSEVIEVGPGDGALTDLILKKCKNLKAFEIDTRFSEFLKQKYSDKNLKVVNQDFLTINLNDHIPNEAIVMGNLPYNV